MAAYSIEDWATNDFPCYNWISKLFHYNQQYMFFYININDYKYLVNFILLNILMPMAISF